jgi:hypothetical protein
VYGLRFGGAGGGLGSLREQLLVQAEHRGVPLAQVEEKRSENDGGAETLSG